MSGIADTYNFNSSELKPKVDNWFNVLWAGGVNNPMDAIEQISYLLFLRLLWEKDEALASLDANYSRIFSGDWAKRGWGNFVTLTGDQLFDALREALENLHNLPGLSPTGRLLFDRATLKIYDRPTLRALVQGVQDIDLDVHGGFDVKGDMYEYLLSRLSVAGRNGQFRTPRHLVNLIVQLVDPKPSERICDPACGTAGFLIGAYQHILRRHTAQATLNRGIVDGQLLAPALWKFLEEQAFTGYDNDATMVKIGIMNLYLHQLERADLRFFNPLTTSLGGTYPGQTFDVILANPPFAGSIQRESILADINLPSTATELLFVKWFLDHLRPSGRAGVIVPNGVLFDTSKAARQVRMALLEDAGLEAVIALPSGVFRPYSGTSTAVLVFNRQGPSGSVWFYDVRADGYSLDDRRVPVAENDFPDLLDNWGTRGVGPNSLIVNRSKIAAAGYSLLSRVYRPRATTPVVPTAGPVSAIDELSRLNRLEADRLGTARASLMALITTLSENDAWPAVEVGEIADIRGGGTPSKGVAEYWHGDIPWVSPKDMAVAFIDDAVDHITARAVAESSANLIPAGSVLVVTRSGILKHTVPIAVTRRAVAINQDIKAFVPRSGVDGIFLAEQFRARSPEILGLVRVGATVQNLETAALRRLRFVLPPLKVQAQWVETISLLRELEGLQSSSGRALTVMFQSLRASLFD